MKFTKTSIEGVQLPPGKSEHIFWDDAMPGFGIRVRKSGAKYYVAQYRIGKKQGRETIGNVAKITLDDARKTARKVFDNVANNINPADVRAEAERKIEQAVPPLIKRFLAHFKPSWSPKYHSDTERALMVYFQGLHAKSLTSITRADVSAELAAIQRERGDVTRNRARAALSKFFNWAIGEGECENNPVDRTNRAEEISRDRAPTESEIKKIWLCLDGPQFSQDERDLVRLMILTLQRENQIGDLLLSEIDLNKRLMEFSRDRVKNKQGGKHVIPITPRAYEIVARRCKEREGLTMLFGKKDTGFANYTHLKEKIDEATKINEHWVFHDLRRSGKTAMSEHFDDIEHEVSEAILNHSKKDMDKVYNNSNYVRKKLAALTQWEEHVMAVVSSDDRKIAA
jgi:integrase